MGEMMTGYQSKRAAALDEEGMYLVHQTAHPKPEQQELVAWLYKLEGVGVTMLLSTKDENNNPHRIFGKVCAVMPESWALKNSIVAKEISRNFTTPPQRKPLTIEYQSGYYDGKKAALAGREWNFCERCGKRTADLTTIHTCTPPQENT